VHSLAGGLVGSLVNGKISQSFAVAPTSVGDRSDAGGLVGKMFAGTILASYARGPATGTSSTDVGGLVGRSLGGSINESYATGHVQAGSSSLTGGLEAQNGASVTNSYYDPISTGQSSSQGGIKDFSLKYNPFTSTTLPFGFEPKIWGFNLTHTYPYLLQGGLSSAQEGYLNGAVVFSDDNTNGVLDPGESSTTTDTNGSFVPIGGTGPLVVYGGTDTSTGLPFKGMLEAPAGSTVITPLTTLVSLLQAQSVADPQTPVLAAFGIGRNVDLTTFDPLVAAMGGAPSGVAAEIGGAEVYDTVSLIASGLASAGSTFGTGAKDAFAAIASDINSGGIDLTDQAAVSGLVTRRPIP
jgi:hypothetical protein